MQIKVELEDRYNAQGLLDVRVIRDRKTGKCSPRSSAPPDRLGVSRQYGFLRFASIRDATLFLDENYPTIYLHSSAVSLAFSRERSERDRASEIEWTCDNVCLPSGQDLTNEPVFGG
jgi:hypothetical protein